MRNGKPSDWLHWLIPWFDWILQLELEQLGQIEAARNVLEQEHEQAILTLKADYNNQIMQQQQLINVSPP